MLTLDKPTDETQAISQRDGIAKALYEVMLSHGDIAAGCPCDGDTLVNVAQEHASRMKKELLEEPALFA